MAGREMRMPKHHAERLPTSKLLHGPEINASPNKPAREAVFLIADGVQISAGKCSECLQEKTVVRALLQQVQRSALGEWKARREVRNVGPQNRGRLVKEYGAAAAKERSASLPLRAPR